MRHVEQPDQRINTSQQRIGMMKFAYIIFAGLAINALANAFEGASHFTPAILNWLSGGC